MQGTLRCRNLKSVFYCICILFKKNTYCHCDHSDLKSAFFVPTGIGLYLWLIQITTCRKSKSVSSLKPLRSLFDINSISTLFCSQEEALTECPNMNSVFWSAFILIKWKLRNIMRNKCWIWIHLQIWNFSFVSCFLKLWSLFFCIPLFYLYLFPLTEWSWGSSRWSRWVHSASVLHVFYKIWPSCRK